jgi:MerR family transcriptional regulator/heat shock protein HspR
LVELEDMLAAAYQMIAELEALTPFPRRDLLPTSRIPR